MENIKKQTVKVEGEQWQNAVNSALEKALKRAELPGFRKGHVPKDVFLKKYGKEALYDDAINECLNEKYFEIVKDLKVIDQPRVDIKSLDDNGFEAEITLTLYPTVELGEYKNLDVKKPDTKVSKKEIDETIENMRKRFAENVIKEGEVVSGDVAIIDFEGFKDGVAFEGGKGENYSLTIGSNTFIPGFEDQVIGMKKGEEKDINVTFPEDYHEESLKGNYLLMNYVEIALQEYIEKNGPLFDKVEAPLVAIVKRTSNSYSKNNICDNDNIENGRIINTIMSALGYSDNPLMMDIYSCFRICKNVEEAKMEFIFTSYDKFKLIINELDRVV